MIQNSMDEMNTGHAKVSAFTGTVYQQVIADTFDDFENDRLQREPLPYTSESDDMMRTLVNCDANVSALTRQSSRELRRRLFFDYMDNYTLLLIHLVKEIRNIKEPIQQGQVLRQLDAMLRWKCCLISREDRLMIPRSHPMEEAVRTFERWISDEQSDSEDLITNEILESQKRRRFRYMVYSTDQVYLRNNKCEEKRGALECIPFREAGQLTVISSIRLIEKVEHYIKTRKEITPQSVVRVACLGKIKDPGKLIKYYQTMPDPELRYQVKLIQLERDKSSSGLLFTVKDSYPEGADSDSDRRMFNLMKLSDLEMLFKQYNIVLFMDEGCFYCQGQEGKSIEERMVQSQLDWILQAARKETKKEDKILYYMQAYRTAGEWLNGLNGDVTARMQFNEKLLKAIQSVMTPQYEVYLYVSYGKRIPVHNLYHRDVCNDENYDGRELAVYKIPSQSRDLSSEVARFIKPVGDKEVCIDLWKIVKSISNKFYDKFQPQDIGDECQWIRLLRNTRLVISWQDSPTDSLTLQFWIKKEGDGNYYEQIGKFVEEILEKGFLNVKHTCVKKYLHRLLGNAVSSRAMDVEGIMVGYLLKDGFFDSRVFWAGFIERDDSDKKDDLVLNSQLFEPRRTILSVMSNLNLTKIRDYERKEEYLLYEFRNRYCPNISEVVFRKLIKAIHNSCINLGYVNNRLYYHSEL